MEVACSAFGGFRLVHKVDRWELRGGTNLRPDSTSLLLLFDLNGAFPVVCECSVLFSELLIPLVDYIV
jgi:hypothetical protein